MMRSSLIAATLALTLITGPSIAALEANVIASIWSEDDHDCTATYTGHMQCRCSTWKRTTPEKP